MDGQHPDWPGTGEFPGSGAASPGGLRGFVDWGFLTMVSHFWLKRKGDKSAVESGAPEIFDLKITPWTKAASLRCIFEQCVRQLHGI